MDGTEVVFHLASIRGAGWSHGDEEFERTNVGLTRQLLRAAAAAGVKRFIYVSSVSVFGHPCGGPIDEERGTAPVTRYGETKLAAEKLVVEAGTREGLPWTIARPVITYGPGDSSGMVTKLVRLIGSRRYLAVGNGENRVHLVYIDDLVEGLVLAMKSSAALGRTFIFAGRQPVTVNTLVGIISSVLGTPVPGVRIPLRFARTCGFLLETSYRLFAVTKEPFLTGDKLDILCRDRCFNSGRATAELGYDPKIDYREGIARTIAWMRSAGLAPGASGALVP